MAAPVTPKAIAPSATLQVNPQFMYASPSQCSSVLYDSRADP